MSGKLTWGKAGLLRQREAYDCTTVPADEADDPLTKLRLGFRKFKQEVVEANPKKFGELVTAQNPKARDRRGAAGFSALL